MTVYLAPGVYYQATDTARGNITAIRTDIAAFIGLAERGPLDDAWSVDSFRQFQTLFGGLTGSAFLAYCIKAFFENGGRRAYIVRVAHEDAARAWAELPGLDGAPTLRLYASSPGRWGNRLQVRLGRARAESTQTQGIQVPDGSASKVGAIAGFSPGTLVRLFQHNSSGDVTIHRVIASVEAAQKRLAWNSPLPLLPTIPGFDLTLPIDLETLAFNLTVYENGRLQAVYTNLSSIPVSPRFAPLVINPDPDQRRRRQSPLPLIELEDLNLGILPADVSASFPDPEGSGPGFSDGLLSLSCGADGLASLVPSDFTGQPGETPRRGLSVLELVEDVSVVAIPDILIRPVEGPRYDHPPRPTPDPCLPSCEPPEPVPLPPPPCPDVAELPPVFDDSQILWVQQQLILHCEQMADRIALIDPPAPQRKDALDPSRVLDWRQQFDSSYAALYYPWVLAPDPLRLAGQVVRSLPPSGHVAGIIARSDFSVGVHRAPANFELAWAQGFSADVPLEWQEVLNPQAINCLRALPGRGLRLYGARTLSSNTQLLYVNVRRLLLMIERALYLSLQWTVFEPNDFNLRQTLVTGIAGFLEELRRRGALAGRSAEEAYFVQCDQNNNPPFLTDLGQLVVDVGVAPVLPAEFVVLRIGRTQDELEITELEKVP